jgi:2-amino-4-hydroxy-6-hydroxymethyldihydropteridine diphosphokinase
MDREEMARHSAPVTVQTAYVSLGSNLGDAEGNLARARGELRGLPDVLLVASSSLYLTEPQGFRDQPWFLNQVVSLECGPTVEPQALLRSLLAIEIRLGRERTGIGGPRVIDLDLLLMGDQVLRSGDLVLPHPRMRERAFVLVPLQEISPGLAFPNGVRIETALAKLAFTLAGRRIRQ